MSRRSRVTRLVRLAAAVAVAVLLSTAIPSSALAEDPVLKVDWLTTPPASGHVIEGAAEVTAEAAGGTFPLVTIDVPDLGTVGYAIRGDVRYAQVDGPAYLEMWSVFADGGRYFSRTLGTEGPMAALDGSSDWRSFELPFYLQGAAPPERLEISVVLPGAGTVAVGPISLIRLDAAALPAAGRGSAIGAIGAVVGVTIGLLGALIGVLAYRGRGRRFVLPVMTIAAGLGVVLMVVSVVAALSGQDQDVIFALLLPGAILAMAFGLALRPVRRGYAEAELRRMRAIDHA